MASAALVSASKAAAFHSSNLWPMPTSATSCPVRLWRKRAGSNTPGRIQLQGFQHCPAAGGRRRERQGGHEAGPRVFPSRKPVLSGKQAKLRGIESPPGDRSIWPAGARGARAGTARRPLAVQRERCADQTVEGPGSRIFTCPVRLAEQVSLGAMSSAASSGSPCSRIGGMGGRHARPFCPVNPRCPAEYFPERRNRLLRVGLTRPLPDFWYDRGHILGCQRAAPSFVR